MIFGMPFRVFFWLVFTVALLSQVYLFFRIRSAILASKIPGRRKTALTAFLGAGMFLLFAANAILLFRPVLWIDPPLAAEFVLFDLPAVWTLGGIFAAFLLLVFRLCGGFCRFAFRARPAADAHPLPDPVDGGRRRFFRTAAGGLASTPVFATAYGSFHGSKAYEVEELKLSFGCPLRVVQLTDIHAGLHMSREEMRRLAERVNALEPDLCVLTGDYISNSVVFLPGCVEEMARIKARYGVYASIGNHDRWFARAGEVESIFRTNRIPLLVNANQVIQTHRGPFAVAGIDDIISGSPDLDATVQGLAPSIPTILLSHRPEIFPGAAARGIRLTLSGHYHGGQVRLTLPGGSTSLADLRTPYAQGLFRKSDSCLYVSRGIGTTFIPVRLNAPPEITLLNLT